ncbi:MAG TPA: N-glycosylase/DNA lyase [Candidatus Lokiarchaeia archaeon]|nr:N-glycosylase/DNA lyase [Candidatus Lokiarchaeia archaeon]
MPTRDELIGKIETLKQSNIKEVIDQRLQDFKSFRFRSSHENFMELCFCILTANCGAEASLKIHEAIGEKFLTAACQEEFTELLRCNGGRFYNMKGKYLASCCAYRDTLKEIMDSFGEDEQGLRQWFVDNILGLGYKEASHFLRNVGYNNLAIIDFHIVDILAEHGFIEAPKTMSKKNYLAIESILRDIGTGLGLNLGTLDLYLWYAETGKIFK